VQKAPEQVLPGGQRNKGSKTRLIGGEPYHQCHRRARLSA
jgi:hypothetical protein